MKSLTEHTEATTPLKSIIKRFKKIKNEDTRQPVILISTGSYNPVHRVHINIFDLIRKGLEEKHKMNVIGSFISPSSYNHYIKYKLGSKAMNDKLRSGLINNSIKDSGMKDFLFLDSWEMSQGCFVDYWEVCEYFTEYIHSKLSKRVRVIYVCGLDHLQKCGCFSLRAEGKGVACLTRFGYNVTEKVKNDENVFLVDGFLDFDMSSTQVRRLLDRKDYKGLQKYMFPSAISHLKKYC